MDKANSKSLKAAFLAAALLALASQAHGQSLSDLQWEAFREHMGEPKVQTHIDPFTTGTSAAEDLMVEDLQLTGIVYRSPSDAFALISGYLVRPGDLIAGYRIDAIERDRVRLRRVDDVFVLVLGGGI